MRIKSFQDITFPRGQETDDIPLELISALQEIPGASGAFDSLGDEQLRRPLTFTRKHLLTGTAIHTELDALRAEVNRRGWLVFETRGSATRGTWAKMTNVSYNNKVEQINYLPVMITFQVSWPWLEAEADVWYFDTGKTFGSGLYFDGNYSTRTGTGSVTVNNTGGDVIRRGNIEITGTTVNPLITNNTNGWSVLYTGTVTAAQRLIIDIGAQTAKLDGTNVWENITIGASQTGIMQYETGNNDIAYTNTSGGGGVIIIHWAKVY